VRRSGGRYCAAAGAVAGPWVPGLRLSSPSAWTRLKRELLLRADKDGISVSEVIRQALRSYVEAN
jgi:hypothetical protein